mgnify:CR=1 FL=1|tara:strand:+ start:24111 stop:25079 length:969 start_codon:yes stop_codon:yes gene_type:complete
MGDQNSILTATVDDGFAGARLDKALAGLLPTLSRERLKALILEGHVASARGEAVRDPARKVEPGQRFTLNIPPAMPAEAEAQDIPLNIVFEDEHLVVVNKPAGLVVHPAAGNLDGTLVNALLHHCAKDGKSQLSGIGGVARPGIVHRIDKDTSGLLVIAKSDAAHEGLAKQFKDHSISRRYLAIVRGVPAPPAGTIDTWIGRSTSDRKKMAVQREGRGKRAITHYRTVEALNNAALVECRLETGRTHQVRVHMTHIGHSLLGDPVYSGRSSSFRKMLNDLSFHRQALHAASLGFIHPIKGERLDFESALPAAMQELLSQLRV